MLLHETNRFTTVLGARTTRANEDTMEPIAEIVEDIRIRVEDLVSTANRSRSDAAFLRRNSPLSMLREAMREVDLLSEQIIEVRWPIQGYLMMYHFACATILRHLMDGLTKARNDVGSAPLQDIVAEFVADEDVIDGESLYSGSAGSFSE